MPMIRFTAGAKGGTGKSTAARFLVRLASHEVHRLVRFRARGMVERGVVKSLKPPVDADERGRLHRRASAVP